MTPTSIYDLRSEADVQPAPALGPAPISPVLAGAEECLARIVGQSVDQIRQRARQEAAGLDPEIEAVLSRSQALFDQAQKLIHSLN